MLKSHLLSWLSSGLLSGLRGTEDGPHASLRFSKTSLRTLLQIGVIWGLRVCAMPSAGASEQDVYPLRKGYTQSAKALAQLPTSKDPNS